MAMQGRAARRPRPRRIAAGKGQKSSSRPIRKCPRGRRGRAAAPQLHEVVREGQTVAGQHPRFSSSGSRCVRLGRSARGGKRGLHLHRPPYGAFISYLDLSILWNHWLGFPVSEQAHDQETIVGGERADSESHYKDSLARSIRACLRLLRPDRWFSIVFQHWELGYFATILETASDCGAELKAAITQTGDVIWSMHKKKNSASVLAGEIIITFDKPCEPAAFAAGHGRKQAGRPRPRVVGRLRGLPLKRAKPLLQRSAVQPSRDRAVEAAGPGLPRTRSSRVRRLPARARLELRPADSPLVEEAGDRRRDCGTHAVWLSSTRALFERVLVSDFSRI